MQGQALGGAHCASSAGDAFSTSKPSTHLEQYKSAGATEKVTPESFPPPSGWDFTDLPVLVGTSLQGSMVSGLCSTSIALWDLGGSREEHLRTSAWSPVTH